MAGALGVGDGLELGSVGVELGVHDLGAFQLRLLIVAGGLVYSAGAAVYALRRPDPAPAVFGYHEVFHLLVIAGVAAHFLAISRYALPTG